MRRMLAVGAGAVLLGGCMVQMKDPTLKVGADSDEWQTNAEFDSRSDASYHGRLADLVVSAKAADPYTPVRLRVRPGDAALVTLSREDGSTGVLGAWRLRNRNVDVGAWPPADPKEYYIGTRVPCALRFGDPVAVPSGADLVVEFDPGTVSPGTSLSSGEPIEFDLRVQVGDDVEFVPVHLKVLDTHHRLYVGYAFK
jgi:hypothetical protein